MSMLRLLVWLAWAALTLYTVAHALLRKTQPASAWGWIGASLLLPFAGPALYALFGVNRVQTRARKRRMPKTREGAVGADHESDARRKRGSERPAVPATLTEVARTGDVITRRPLLDHNRLEILHNGEQAYPRMLAAIEAAQVSVALMSYIFETDVVGERFVEALARAQARGVEVRCVLDGIGELAWRRAGSLLRARGIRVARYNPLRFWPPFLHANLRNHRKLLIVDGRLGYAGGMNLCRDHLVDDPGNPYPTRDLHVELRGPVLSQLMLLFLDDWAYASGEEWQLPAAPDHEAPAAPTPHGEDVADSTICRVIADGPNEDYGHLTMVLLAAISAAQTQVQIVTPYFLPPEEILTALLSASLRGVHVDVVLSRQTDHPLTHWATQKLFPRLLERGLRLHYQPPPFCHTKLFVVDGRYAQFGSANLDSRSLGLNFELMVEVYDEGFAGRLGGHCEALIANSHRVTREEVRALALPAKLRNAACWLFTPYL
ncbi:MAG: cardiolipin synthase [Nevskia sp.]